MKPNPLQGLLKSRKFWLLILDVVVSTVLFGVAAYAPQYQEVVKFAVATYQPVFVFLIVSIAVEDAAAMKAGTHPSQWGAKPEG